MLRSDCPIPVGSRVTGPGLHLLDVFLQFTQTNTTGNAIDNGENQTAQTVGSKSSDQQPLAAVRFTHTLRPRAGQAKEDVDQSAGEFRSGDDRAVSNLELLWNFSR